MSVTSTPGVFRSHSLLLRSRHNLYTEVSCQSAIDVSWLLQLRIQPLAGGSLQVRQLDSRYKFLPSFLLPLSGGAAFYFWTVLAYETRVIL